MHKTDSYFWAGTWIGWIISWTFLGWNNTVDFLLVNGSVTISDFILINFLPLIFISWDSAILYRSRDLFSKLNRGQVMQILAGITAITVIFIVIVFPLLTQYKDIVLF